jgi:protein-S-isoprenylcysteine O-methyltransferase Ste14
MKTRWTNYFAALLWAAFTGLRLREFLNTQAIIPVLLAVQAGMVAYYLIRRRDTSKESKSIVQVLSWGSALLPLALQIKEEHTLGVVINIAGLCLVLWSIASLGRSFGIAPADRGLVRSGPYRWVRHPMYAGEILAIIGALIGNLTIRNDVLFAVLILSIILRIEIEERILFGYRQYREQTTWRLFPGVW